MSNAEVRLSSSSLHVQFIKKMRAHEPDGLKEEWGVCEFDYVPDFRMNLGKYRVVGVMPQKHALRNLSFGIAWFTISRLLSNGSAKIRRTNARDIVMKYYLHMALGGNTSRFSSNRRSIDRAGIRFENRLYPTVIDRKADSVRNS